MTRPRIRATGAAARVFRERRAGTVAGRRRGRAKWACRSQRGRGQTDGAKCDEGSGGRSGWPSGAPPPVAAAPADPASRAIALRRKTLREEDFLDNDESNRDPFKSFMRLFIDKGVVKTRQLPAIFEKFALEELDLIAVVSGDAQPRAMFRDPGGLGQTVKRGDYVSKSGARITKILSDRVILEIAEPTSTGEPRAIEKAVLVHPEEEAQK